MGSRKKRRDVPITYKEHYLLQRLRQLRRRSRCGILIIRWEDGKIFWESAPTVVSLDSNDEVLDK